MLKSESMGIESPPLIVEPHLHLDCAHSPEAIKKVSEEFNIKEFEGQSADQIRERIHAPQGANWASWYEHLKIARRSYVSPEAIGRLAEEVLKEWTLDGVDIVELRISLLSTVDTFLQNADIRVDKAGYWYWAKKIFDAIIEAAQRKKPFIQTDLVMSVSCQQKYRAQVADLMRLCWDYREHIIAIDLTNEKDTPPQEYRPSIEWIRGTIKFLTVHCMEVTGPERGWNVLALEPDRIGHGLAVLKDEALVDRFRSRGTPFEMCVRSNLVTGTVPSLAEHPIKRIYDRGIPIVIGSDGCNDGSRLSDNYSMLGEIGFTSGQIQKLRQNAWRYAFRNLSASSD